MCESATALLQTLCRKQSPLTWLAIVWSAGFVWEQPCGFLRFSLVVLPGILAETAGDSAVVPRRLSGLVLRVDTWHPGVKWESARPPDLRSEMWCGFPPPSLLWQVRRPDAFQEMRGTLPRWEQLQSHCKELGLREGNIWSHFGKFFHSCCYHCFSHKL